MTSQNDFKRLVRRRMQKTGESYTSARATLLRTRNSANHASPAGRKRSSAAAKPDYATLAGMSDAAVAAKTGCRWDKWVFVLDRAGAHEWPHREIAAHVRTRYPVSDWWAQTVTVGYERIKGLRAIGQRRDGGYEANRSRTFAVPIARLYRAASDRRMRAKWLPDIDLTVRKATATRSLRITWPDATPVEFWFTDKGPSKSQIQISHRKLGTREQVASLKAFWGERLDALGRLLSPTAKVQAR
jgi:hypothetical protein